MISMMKHDQAASTEPFDMWGWIPVAVEKFPLKSTSASGVVKCAAPMPFPKIARHQASRVSDAVHTTGSASSRSIFYSFEPSPRLLPGSFERKTRISCVCTTTFRHPSERVSLCVDRLPPPHG